jgi:hypothetical protein
MLSNSFSASSPSSVLKFGFRTLAIVVIICGISTVSVHAQGNVLTQHNDNTRSGATTNETILTPTNVNPATFGVIASRPVDGLISAQPLFVSGISIPGQGVRNVVYAVTLHDSVYAFDVDSNSATPLWQVSFLNPAAGITTEPPAELGCITTTFNTEMGILGTPAIDASSSTIYVLAKTKENGTYHFRLHALDLGTGFEKFGGPIDVNGSVTGKAGTLSLITAGKNMMARPGLLLSQGIIYLAFGSNGCDGGGTRGWVVAYDAGSLLQLGIFNTAPDSTIAHGNIWQAGGGLASDNNGNIFFSTANGPFDANLGNKDYGSSVLRIGWGANGLGIVDYFTPFDQALLTGQDLDLSSAGVTMLPDQPGLHPHLLVASGKTGDVYVLDRDNMGQYNSVDNSQIAQYLPTGVGRMFSTAAYWNGSVYFTGESDGVAKFSLVNGQLALAGRNATVLCCAHTPSISANGNTNGILWVANGAGFSAFDATDMTKAPLYNLAKLGTLAHFNTPTIANGKVYVGANLSLQVLGLLANLRPTSGNNQTVPSGGVALPFQVTAKDAYTGAPVAGASVTFNKSFSTGQFTSMNPVTTDASGRASVSFTVPVLAGTYAITASYPGSATATFNVTVVGGTPTHILVISGGKQTGQLLTTLSAPLVVQLSDVSNNGVPGGSITFSVPTNPSTSGSFSSNPVTTDSKGRAQTFYTSGTRSGAISITAKSGALQQGMSENIQPAAPTALTIIAGNSQKAPAGTTLTGNLSAKVVDQYNNGIPGKTVAFGDGGVGGSFAASQIVTDAQGRAIVSYTLPTTPQVVHVTASFPGVSPVVFTETAQ